MYERRAKAQRNIAQVLDDVNPQILWFYEGIFLLDSVHMVLSLRADLGHFILMIFWKAFRYPSFYHEPLQICSLNCDCRILNYGPFPTFFLFTCIYY